MIKVQIIKYFYYCCIILNSIIHPAVCTTKSNAIDSIVHIIQTTREDSILVKNYNNLAWEYANFDIDTSIYLSRKSLLISEEINYQQGISNALHTLGALNYMKNNYDSSLYFYNKAIAIRIKLNDKRQLASTYNNIALTYNILCEYEKSIKYGFNALELRETYNDTLGIAQSLNNIGTTYHYMGRYNEAIKFYSRSIIFKEHIGNKQEISSTLNNIGLIYFEKGIDENQSFFDSSLYYHNKALKYRNEIGFEPGIAESYLNIANVYVTDDKSLILIGSGYTDFKDLDSMFIRKYSVNPDAVIKAE